jgi:hypothetical protein
LVVVGCGGAFGGAVGGPGDEDAVGEDEEGEEADDGADDDEDEVLWEGGGVEVGGAGSRWDGGRWVVVASREGWEVEGVVGVGAYCREAGWRERVAA